MSSFLTELRNFWNSSDDLSIFFLPCMARVSDSQAVLMSSCLAMIPLALPPGYRADKRMASLERSRTCNGGKERRGENREKQE